MKLSIQNKIGIVKAKAAGVSPSANFVSQPKRLATNNLSKSIRNVEEANDFKIAYQQAVTSTILKGFSLNINNTTNEEQFVKLFQEGGLPYGVSVTVHNNSNYNYSNLLLMANTKGFTGNEVYTNEIKINQLHIYNNEVNEVLPFNNFHLHNNTPIIIDGFLKYIAITVPPISNLTFKLK